MKHLLAVLAASAACLAFAACSDNGTSPGGTTQPRAVTKTEQAVLEANNTFGLGLLAQLSTTAPGDNVFISPLSVSMALGMALNGAANGTWDDMRSTLGFAGLSDSEINTSYRSLIDLLRGLDPKVRFDIANSIWHRQGFEVLPDFLSVNQTFFDAEVRALNFDDPSARDIINAWVSAKTSGKIPTIIDEPISPDVVMYLINAIYFKGTWATEFNSKSTKQAPFTTAAGVKTVDMMYRQGQMPYRDNGQVQIVDLPYGNGKYSMTVVLPKTGTNIDALANTVNPQVWKEWADGLSSADVVLGLPKMKLEYKQDLKDVLSTLGMEIAFSGSADFSRISTVHRLYISKVMHKTFVEVNEEGTEAAAVTSVEFRNTSAGDEKMMIVNRPFIFAIREHHTGSILFIGKVAKLGQ